MSEIRGIPSERPGDRRQLGRFLRTTVKLFLLAFVVAALLSPPDPLSFTMLLVPAWIVSVPLAYYLVYRDGYAVVRASPAYRPGPLVGRTTPWFAAIALGLKVVLALVYQYALSLTYGRTASLLLSLVALAIAYVLVYQGVLGWTVSEGQAG